MTNQQNHVEGNQGKLFGVFCDSYFIKKWQYQSLEHILVSSKFRIGLIVINESEAKSHFKFKNVAFFMFKKIFTRLLLMETVDIRNLLDDIPVISAKTFRKGNFSEYFHPEDIAEIKSFKLEFALRFGFGIIRGEILDIAKYGIWSFHHGDDVKYRGGPYCFWELYENEPTTNSVLQKLTDKLDGGVVLKKGYFKTIKHSFSKNIEQAIEMTIRWPLLVCLELENKTFNIPQNEDKALEGIRRLPSNAVMVKFVFRLIGNKIAHFYTKYLTFDFWHIGIIDKNLKDVLNSEIVNTDIRWLEQKSPLWFLADPFLFKSEEETILITEKLEYKKFIGEIKAFKGNGFNQEINNFDILEDYHLSYPNTFIIEGVTYCLPEGYDAGGLYLYEKQDSGWYKHLLIPGIKCIDPEIIYVNGIFYLFTTIKGDNHETKLFIYHSLSILGDWEPHCLNPVIHDVRVARGAGKIFKDGDDLYRPGQNYSISKEGSIMISKIVKLSPLEYQEEIAYEILPIVDSPYPSKIHTINSLQNMTVVDACIVKSLLLRPDIFARIVLSKL